MPQWGPFLAVVVVLTVLLLVLARQSQEFIREHAGNDNDTAPEASTVGSHPDDPFPGEDHDTTPVDERDAAPVDERDAASAEPFHDEHTHVEPDPSDADSHDTGDGHSKAAGTLSDRQRDPVVEEPEPQLTSGLLLANVAVTQAVVAAIIVAAAWYFSIPATAFGIAAEPLAAGLPGVAVGVVFGLALWLANELSTTLADAVGAAYDETVRELLAPASPRGWAGLFLVVLPLIALSEELLFRAALIGVPAAGFDLSPWLLAVGSSLAFALGHGAQGRVGIIVTGVLGFVLAAGYILTGSLLVVVVAHYVINAMEFFVYEFLGVDDVVPLAVAAGYDPQR